MSGSGTRLGRACWTLGFLKIAYLGVVIVTLRFWADMDRDAYSRVDQRWPRREEPIFGSHLATWDAAHYLYLSEVGYSKGVHSCAFYPLWPLLVRGLSVITGGSHLIAGLVLANVLSLIAWVIFLRLVAQQCGAHVANLSLGFLLAYPGALFFQFIYSESLLLLLAVLLWWGLERKRYGLAGVAALLLPMARAVGLFCLFPILWHLVTKEPLGWMMKLGRQVSWLGRLAGAGTNRSTGCGALRSRLLEPPGTNPHEENQSPEKGPHETNELETRGPWRPTTCPTAHWQARSEMRNGNGEARTDRNLVTSAATRGPWWLLLAPLLGWGCYLALMWHWTGNPFEGFEAQKHWGGHSISNLWSVLKFVLGLFSPTYWHAFTGSLLDRCVFILLLYCLPLIWRLDKGLFIWAWVLGVVPAMSGTFTSFTRFASCTFPMFIALGVFLSKPERRWLRFATLTVFAVLHVVLVWRFVNFRWAG